MIEVDSKISAAGVCNLPPVKPGSRRRFIVLFLVVVVLAVGVRLGAMLGTGAYHIASPWAFGYEAGSIAGALARGEGFSSPFGKSTGPTAWLMPVYPALLATVFKVFGSYTLVSGIVALAFNCLVSGLTVIPVFRITRAISGARAAWVAGVLFALYPVSIWHAFNTIWDTTLFTFLGMMLLDRLYSARAGWRWAAGTGLLLGVTALTNAMVLAFLPIMLAWAVFKGPEVSLRRRFAAAVVITCVAGTVLMPWITRNYLVLGQPSMRSNFGAELYYGNNSYAWGVVNSRSGEPVPADTWKVFHPTINHREMDDYVRLGETEYCRSRFNKSLAMIRNDLPTFARVSLYRFSIYWCPDLRGNDWGGSINSNLPVPIAVIKQTCALLPLPFFCLGLAVALWKRMRVGLLVGYLATLPVVSYITHFAGERYRHPIEPVMLIFACVGLCWLGGIVRIAVAAIRPHGNKRNTPNSAGTN